ncbi:hypothetical protein I5O09_01810 [Pseudomonas parafulva]|uniref:hypothetical protein n=1 Tax=Pseudomonas parafulva TaxID=157782 RepID=UPI0018D82AF2|nr:hypothetical protein [Pseudomonas parafulva]MBH3342471.1 hypothetical protein [Pseudomonas parafulva]
MSIFERVRQAKQKARQEGKTVELSLTREEWDEYRGTVDTDHGASIPSINTGPSAPVRVVLEHAGNKIYITA